MGGQAGGHGGRIAGAGLQGRQQTGQLLEVAQFVEREGKAGQLLRVGIQGGGCSGLSYIFSFTPGPDAHDRVFEGYGQKIVVDPKSLRFLGGSVLEWQESLMKSGFVVKNPSEVKSCSCGESFSV
jgi:iron-sulfur cluster assembly protein